MDKNKNLGKKKRSWLSKVLWGMLAVVLVLLLIPQQIQNPVEGCGPSSYNHQTFWHPWGNHHHHGIDIFAKQGTPLHPACAGVVVATMSADAGHAGGNCLTILGTHGRVYYYAHLKELRTHVGAFVTQSDVIGTVGNTGNAFKGGKGAPHCHFAILSVIPQLKHWVPAGERTMKDDVFKMFFVNPVESLRDSKGY
jgi:murein DD-endopeptidase MepM/ murein hydrolase activator NlpD